MTDIEFHNLQIIENNTWSIPDTIIRKEKERREKVRYPLICKQLGLIGRYQCLDTSDLVIWDIGAGPCQGISSILPCKSRLCIDPNKEAYSEYYNVQNYDNTKAEDLKQRLSEPDVIIATNCIDHFQDPMEFLEDLNTYMRYGTYFIHHHASDNAIQHKHEAHVFNLNEEMVDVAMSDNFEKVWYMNYKEDGLVYSWLKERAFCAIYRRTTQPKR